ncbi:MAG: DnaD domain protein [Clostridia bacterium]|nr:DnaD domain protein [Clostridia bacterium]
MKFASKSKLNLSDTLVPDLFILNNMNELEHIDLKLYLYILFLEKQGLEIDETGICKKLNISEEELSFSLDRLCSEELLMKNMNGYTIIDIKENEINKKYTPLVTPKKSKETTEQEKIRIIAASSINESFFDGLMPYGWYSDIGDLFNKFDFESDVMIALFQYCYERKALNKKYVYAVAETWHKGNVKTFEDLDKYFDEVSKQQKIINKITKALGLNRELTKYEKEYVNRWINEYSYDFNMIEQALKRTVNKTNPSINYVNGILKNWHEKGFTKPEEIEEENKKIMPIKIKDKNDSIKFKNLSSADFENLESFYDIM